MVSTRSLSSKTCTYALLNKLQLLRLQQLLRYPGRILLRACTELPEVLTKLRRIFIEETGERYLELFDVWL